MRRPSKILADFRNAEFEEAQQALIRWIIRKGDNEEHKLALVRSAMDRAGTNRFGRSVLAQALENGETPQFRAKLWQLKLKRGTEDGLVELLASEEAESVKLAGLAAAKKGLVEDMRGRFSTFRRRTLIESLRQSVEREQSNTLKSAVLEILAWIRKRAVRSKVGEIKDMMRDVRNIITTTDGLPEEEKKKALHGISIYLVRGERYVADLEKAFGELTPEEKSIIESEIRKVRTVIEKLPEEYRSPKGETNP